MATQRHGWGGRQHLPAVACRGRPARWLVCPSLPADTPLPCHPCRGHERLICCLMMTPDDGAAACVEPSQLTPFRPRAATIRRAPRSHPAAVALPQPLPCPSSSSTLPAPSSSALPFFQHSPSFLGPLVHSFPPPPPQRTPVPPPATLNPHQPISRPYHSHADSSDVLSCATPNALSGERRWEASVMLGVKPRRGRRVHVADGMLFWLVVQNSVPDHCPISPAHHAND